MVATLDKAKELANKIICGTSNNIDRILVFGSIALREAGNDIDIIVIVKSSARKTQKHFYSSI